MPNFETKKNKSDIQTNFPKLINRLKELQESKGISQRQIYSKLGFSDRAYRTWLNGERAPSLDFLIKLSQFYDVSIDYLVGISDFTHGDHKYINEVTGLTDKSIQTLKSIKKNNISIQGVNILNTINQIFSNKNLLTALMAAIGFYKNNEYLYPTHLNNDGTEYDKDGNLKFKHHWTVPKKVEWNKNEKTFVDVPSDNIYLTNDPTNPEKNIPIKIDKSLLQAWALQKMQSFLDAIK